MQTIYSREMKILVVDNYDSFTYNLVQMIRKVPGSLTDVVRNDKVTPGMIDRYDRIILSPGPGLPSEAGALKKIIGDYAGEKGIFGVCLGMQAIGEVFGATLENLQTVFHGVATDIIISEPVDSIFRDVPHRFLGGRYHSWVVSGKNLPECLFVSSFDEDGRIMSLSHKTMNIKGVQFHPESVLTPCGLKIISNWLSGTEEGNESHRKE
jgi:anthranilate synthase component 2